MTKIWTDKQFEEEALVFLNKKWNSFNKEHPFDLPGMAYDYVRQSDKFKYKDPVEAGVITTILVNLGYFEFHNRINDIRYHIMTEKGKEFVAQKRNK